MPCTEETLWPRRWEIYTHTHDHNNKEITAVHNLWWWWWGTFVGAGFFFISQNNSSESSWRYHRDTYRRRNWNLPGTTTSERQTFNLFFIIIYTWRNTSDWSYMWHLKKKTSPHYQSHTAGVLDIFIAVNKKCKIWKYVIQICATIRGNYIKHWNSQLV